jgi:hypothetical protein
MIEMPVGIYEVRDWTRTEILEGPGNLVARYTDARIDQQFAIRAGKYTDVSA